MEDIRVVLREPVPHGRLIYRPDPQIDHLILFIQSEVQEPIKYIVNINGAAVILDVTADHILHDVEFAIPRPAWKVAPLAVFPHPTQTAALALPDLTQRYTQIVSPAMRAVVTTNDAQSYAQILFGEAPLEATWVALSDQCLALVAGDRLKGFFVRLKEVHPQID